jgi:hypothetical protein
MVKFKSPLLLEGIFGRHNKIKVLVFGFMKPSGAGDQIRTGDLLITNQLLCLLSYTGIHANQNTTIAAFIRQEESVGAVG